VCVCVCERERETLWGVGDRICRCIAVCTRRPDDILITQKFFPSQYIYCNLSRGHSAFVLTVAINGNKNLVTAFRENLIRSPEKIRLSDYVRFVLLAGDEWVVTSGMRYGVLWMITKEILKRKLLPTFSR
jgi:hypothetical protein